MRHDFVLLYQRLKASKMHSKTEEFLNLLFWSATIFTRPTFRNLTDSYEGWAYSSGLMRQIYRLERQQMIEREAGSRERSYRLSAQGRLQALGGRDPEERWDRKWDGQWRLVLFDVSIRQNARRERLRRTLRDRCFGYLQNSAWITPDWPIDGHRIAQEAAPDVSSFLVIEGRPAGGKSDADLVSSAWNFENINRLYARYLKVLDKRPGGNLRNDTRAKAFLRWAAEERADWIDAVTMDPLLPKRLLP